MDTLGSLATFAGVIWVAVIGFKESTLQGLLCLFIPFYALYYIYKQWPETRNAMYLLVGGLVLFVLGALM